MIRTILSSFLFLLPIYVSFLKQDTLGLFMFTIAMGLSIANHSHTFHTNYSRKLLFQRMDVVYMHCLGGVIGIQSYSKYPLFLVLIVSLINYQLYINLGNREIEHYNSFQRSLHVVFHIIGITSLTVGRYY